MQTVTLPKVAMMLGLAHGETNPDRGPGHAFEVVGKGRIATARALAREGLVEMERRPPPGKTTGSATLVRTTPAGRAWARCALDALGRMGVPR
jgi:hypothetical protein